jgi:hypothetical protein
MRRLLRLVVAAGLVGAPLQGQELACLANETLLLCNTRLDSLLTHQAAPEPSDTAGAATLDAALGAKTVGIGSLGSGFSSAIGDFLPTLAGALGLTQTTTQDGATSLETNLRLPFGSSVQRVRLQALIRKPTVYQPLQDSLPAASRDETVDALTKELNDYDDVGVNLAWNLENGTFGRNFDIARSLATRLVREGLSQLTHDDSVRAATIYLEVLKNSTASLAPSADTLPACRVDVNLVALVAPLSCFTTDEQGKLAAAMIQTLKAARATEEQLHRLLVNGGFFRLTDLVNNQPQLSFEAGLNLRRDLVGPNDLTITARYEGGFANFNGLRRYGREHCGLVTEAAMGGACFQRYLADPGVISAIKHGDRFFVSGTFTRRQDSHLSLPADSVNIVLAGTWDFTASAGYGRYVAFNSTGDELGRIDLSGDYILHHDDPTRQNRLVLAGTFTYRLSAGLSIAAGVSYASKPEFLTGVDKKFGANFGLRYKLLRS